ncbi:hypothetical protein A3Q56_02098 [Intoshia linei]|uniref:Uncharacterized protein n=1 Tax=Intoshia linei TaxID=1819745 RepID=A0A177B7Q6_9BILA|nr:hypothetical protein A3Q56_02098 [Intoshia linei]
MKNEESDTFVIPGKTYNMAIIFEKLPLPHKHEYRMNLKFGTKNIAPYYYAMTYSLPILTRHNIVVCNQMYNQTVIDVKNNIYVNIIIENLKIEYINKENVGEIRRVEICDMDIVEQNISSAAQFFKYIILYGFGITIVLSLIISIFITVYSNKKFK